MTTDLEKQFFDTFGIETRLDCKRCGAKDFALGQCWEVNCEKTYPQITDRILFKLMELLMKQQATEFYYHDEYLFSSKFLGSDRPTCNKTNNLRELILRTATCLSGFTPLKDKMLPQIQALFKE